MAQHATFPVDIILCSDLIYGDAGSSQLLLESIYDLVSQRRQYGVCSYIMRWFDDHQGSPGCIVIFCYEARWSGDRGASFFRTLARSDIRHSLRRVTSEEMHREYQDENIHIYLLHLL